MFGNVTALVGWIYIGKIQEQKHAAHMLQACGLGSSHLCLGSYGGARGVAVSYERGTPVQCSVSTLREPCLMNTFVFRYRGTSLTRNRPPPRTTVGPQA